MNREEILQKIREVGLVPVLRAPSSDAAIAAAAAIESGGVPVLEIVVVRSSSGIWEERPLIETVVRLGPITKRIQVTVTNRSRMLFRMILGRKALEGDFVVDVSKKYLLRSTDR